MYFAQWGILRLYVLLYLAVVSAKSSSSVDHEKPQWNGLTLRNRNGTAYYHVNSKDVLPAYYEGRLAVRDFAPP